MNLSNVTLQRALAKLLKPLIKLLLRCGVPFGEFSDIAKQVYVEVAFADFAIPSRKQSATRVSVLTGINRKDVAKALKGFDKYAVEKTGLNRNRAFRVVNGWAMDERFNDEQGNPAPLNLSATAPSFQQLAKEYSVDVSVRALIDELRRIGAVVVDSEANTVELLENSYIPTADTDEQLRIFGDAAHDLLSTIEYNLDADHVHKRFQRTMSYDYIDAQALGDIQEISQEKIKVFMSDYGQWLSHFDKEVNPGVQVNERSRAGIGVYYIQEAFNGGDEDD